MKFCNFNIFLLSLGLCLVQQPSNAVRVQPVKGLNRHLQPAILEAKPGGFEPMIRNCLAAKQASEKLIDAIDAIDAYMSTVDSGNHTAKDLSALQAAKEEANKQIDAIDVIGPYLRALDAADKSKLPDVNAYLRHIGVIQAAEPTEAKNEGKDNILKFIRLIGVIQAAEPNEGRDGFGAYIGHLHAAEQAAFKLVKDIDGIDAYLRDLRAIKAAKPTEAKHDDIAIEAYFRALQAAKEEANKQSHAIDGVDAFTRVLQAAKETAKKLNRDIYDIRPLTGGLIAAVQAKLPNEDFDRLNAYICDFRDQQAYIDVADRVDGIDDLNEFIRYYRVKQGENPNDDIVDHYTQIRDIKMKPVDPYTKIHEFLAKEAANKLKSKSSIKSADLKRMEGEGNPVHERLIIQQEYVPLGR